MERIREIIRAIPFRPFVIELVSGKQVPVRHPDDVSLAPAGRTLIFHAGRDGMEIIDVLLITDVRVEGLNPAMIWAG